jgi:thymidylate synthase
MRTSTPTTSPQIELQLAREPRPLPHLNLRAGAPSIFDFKFEDFSIQGYDPHPAIRGTISV